MRDLPTGWVWKEVRTICSIQTGKKDVNQGSPTGKYLFFTCAAEPLKSEEYSFNGESILLPGNGANVGLVSYFNGEFEAYQRTYILNDFSIGGRYLYFYFLGAWKNSLIDKQYGSATNYIRLANITEFEVPIAPLNEQHRIVAKLEKLLAKVNACGDRLDKIPTILKRFRQSVLAAACSGRLTADWREQHPGIEPAEDLLKRIQDERIRHYEDDCERAKAEGRRKPKAPFYKDESIAELNIPLLWGLTYLGNITDAQGGIQKTPKRRPTNNPYPYLRVANVYRGYLNLDAIEYFEIFDNKELDKWKLKKGDLLVVEGNGSPTEIGRCALWNEEIPDCVHQNHIIRMRPFLNIDSSFLLTYLNAPQGREVMMQLSSSTSGLHTLSVGKINNIVIPLPPLEEQQEIVRRVEALFQKCDQIEARYEKAKAYTDKLTQAILAKAFRGELVPQDPNDEPAEVLLERIKAEKAAAQPQKKPSKPRRREAKA
ncbi:restriction endonuclease subunit S [Synechocystis sp. PCC 7338]|uniref:restriction endonuclease subunit S n=1 Tax=Synechocystis sp. PCC 7338 TaxID=2732530 RepID=UPI001BAEEE43|nr:restriction endonuclease subunit S [Synechocystis sp. PCC 7338]QUS60554.1 restriction endonuclease subunit S [Synechocystis sp. PCC 7338]